MKAKKFIRSGLHLPVKHLRTTLDYYRDVLGFYNEWTFGDKDGGIQRDEMRLLFAEDATFTFDINNDTHRLPLLWFVDDIEAVYAEYQQNSIKIADELKTHPYGVKEFAFIDINGYYVRVAEQVRTE